MCRVLGITNFDYSRHREMIERFCTLVETGVVMAEDPPGHEDGWGLAFYRNGQLEVQKSGANLLAEIDKVNRSLSALRLSPLVILHLRKSAWANTANTRHAHPFFKDNNVFFHNGVVYDYQSLIPQIKTPGPGLDARDTEVFFYHVLSQLPACHDLGQAVLRSVAYIKRHHRYSALNCLVSDGRFLYAYRDFAKEPDYYTLYKASLNGSRFIASEPLGHALSWELMAQEEFLRIKL